MCVLSKARLQILHLGIKVGKGRGSIGDAVPLCKELNDHPTTIQIRLAKKAVRLWAMMPFLDTAARREPNEIWRCAKQSTFGERIR